MEDYVGRIAIVIQDGMLDKQGCDVVRVGLDYGRHYWRVVNLRFVGIDDIDDIQRELTRRMALLYEEYGAPDAENIFLNELYNQDALDVRMRLQLTHLLFNGSLEERDGFVGIKSS